MDSNNLQSGLVGGDALKILCEVSSRFILDLPVPDSPSQNTNHSGSDDDDVTIDVETVFEPELEFTKSLSVKKQGRACKVMTVSPQTQRERKTLKTLSVKLSEWTHSCHICGKNFKRTRFCRAHMRLLHKGREKFLCKICGKTFLLKTQLRQHMACHRDANALCCNICGKFFSRLSYLQLHKWVHSGEIRENRHINASDNSVTSPRQMAPEETSDFLTAPMRLRSGLCKRFAGSKCGKYFRERTSSNLHMSKCLEKNVERCIKKLHHKRKKRKKPRVAEKKCPHCGKSFKRTGNFKIHLRVHTGEKNFLCDYCGRSFSRLGNLNTHLLIHTGERPHLCADCGRSFTTAGNLKSHRIHSVNKPCHVRSSNASLEVDDMTPYCCDRCGAQFCLMSQYETHLKSHGEKEPYDCKLCDKKFDQLCRLRIHLDEHKPHKCEECGKGFLQRSSLKTHQRIHAQVKPYVCRYCSKGFAQKGNMDAHMFIHTGEKMFPCMECGKAFATKYRLKSHSSVHKSWDQI